MVNGRTIRSTALLALSLLMAIPSSIALAGSANLSISRREGYVGSPLAIQIIINDAEQDTTPSMPDVPGPCH